MLKAGGIPHVAGWRAPPLAPAGARATTALADADAGWRRVDAGSRPTRRDQARPRGVTGPVIAAASLARAVRRRCRRVLAARVSYRDTRPGAMRRARIQGIADVHDRAARRTIPRAPAGLGAIGGVSEPAYPSLGMGRAGRARYPEAWDVSRPCIGPVTPSTPCSIRSSPSCQRPAKQSHSGSPIGSQCGAMTGPRSWWLGGRLCAPRGGLLLGVLGAEAGAGDRGPLRTPGPRDRPEEARGAHSPDPADHARPLCHRFLGRPASESGPFCQAVGARGGQGVGRVPSHGLRARRTPSCLRREASSALLRRVHLPLDGGGGPA